MVAEEAWSADLRLAIAHGGAEAARRVLALKEAEKTDHRAVAMGYCAVAQAFPEEKDLPALMAISVSFGDDAELAIAVIAAINGVAARRPLDAPPRMEGPEHDASRLAEAWLARAEESPALLSPTQVAYLHINRANALRAQGAERDTDAVAAYEAAIERIPDNGAWHLDLAVCHKWRGRWQLALDSALRARARMDPHRGLLWNLAIAATALGDGDLAAGVWRDLGIDGVRLSAGGLPLVEGIPTRLVRVRCRRSEYGFSSRPEVGYEQMQVAPLSPVHGVVMTPSFENTPIDYGDVVLWDGAPVAVENTPQGAVPVFPALEILRKAEEKALRFVGIMEPEELGRLGEALGVGLVAAQRPRLFAHPGGAEREGEQLVYGKLILMNGVDPRHMVQRLEAFGKKERTLRLAVPGLYELCGDSRRAGQEHQAWKGVERVAIKKGLAPTDRDEST